MPIKSLEDIKHSFYINLDHRIDRKEIVEKELIKIGITAERFNAIKMDNGAIGCTMSHMKLLQDAEKKKLEYILIIEDDIKFLDPELFKKNINKFFETHQNNWDVILLAGNNIPPYEKIDDTCIKVSRCQTTTGYIVNGHYIKILLQNVKMGLTYLLNKPEEHKKYAIDKYWFLLQSVHRWYLIIPPTVVQREGYSDIEKRVTNFENPMQDLDKEQLMQSIMVTNQKYKIQK